jgi:hypothetical protein
MDYILKNDMDPDNILKILESVVMRAKNDNDTAKDKNNQAADISLSKEGFLSKLIEQEDIENPEDYARGFNLQFGKNNILVCCLLVDDYMTVIERYREHGLKVFTTSVFNAVRQILNEIRTGEVLSISPQEYIILFSFESMNVCRQGKRPSDSLKSYTHA